MSPPNSNAISFLTRSQFDCEPIVDSLNRAARMESKLKVRQPLAKVEVILAEAQAVDVEARRIRVDQFLFDGRRGFCEHYSSAFVEVASEKMLIYALGRGMEYQDMPLVRAVARQANRSNNRFSALVLAVVKSDPFQKNAKLDENPAPKQAAAAPKQTASR